MGLIKKLSIPLLAFTLSANALGSNPGNPEKAEKTIDKYVNYVQSNPTGTYEMNGSEVNYLQKGNKSIHVGDNYVAFMKNSSNGGVFAYDIGKDGDVERMIFTDGKVPEKNKAGLDMDGLAGGRGLETEAEMSKGMNRNESGNPYNNRRIFNVNEEKNEIGIYDFKNSQAGNIKGHDKVEEIQKNYRNFINSFKGLLD